MPIRIVDRISTKSGIDRLFIESDALRLIQREMKQYCDREIDGRSFLVSGHRGAGKTTLVEGALNRILNAVEQSDIRERLTLQRPRGTALRPLLVKLQGPNLLPPSEDERAATSARSTAKAGPKDPDANAREGNKTDEKESAQPDESQEKSPPVPSPMETVLIQITLGLHRALTDAFAEAFHIRARQLFELNTRSSPGRGDRTTYRRALRDIEQAAQLELDLDQNPGLARLREYWRSLGALESGVLSSGPGNGFDELVALSSVSEAYQRISGTFSRKEEHTSGAERKAELAWRLDAKGSALLKPLSALLAGSAVGAGLVASHAGVAPAVFTGLLTALASTAVFQFSMSRANKQAVNHSELFIPDLSVASLARILPVLIARVQRAGFAPIFVVDELDKVDVSSRITDMVKQLKKFVAEQSFFCFLTDRKYFEELTTRTAENPYPIEYTYYSHQLFIAYRHTDLHKYLKEVLKPTQPQTPAQPTPAPPPNTASAPDAAGLGQSGPATGTQTASAQASSVSPASAAATGRTDDDLDALILPYLLLQASQMHTIDLRRQLLTIQNDNGEIAYAPGLVRGRLRFRFALMVQLATEAAFEDEAMQAEIDFQPSFLQIARDALYYISRRWRGAKVLDLSDETGHADFRKYLLSRMATEANLQPTAASTETPARPGSSGETSQAPSASSLIIEENTAVFLFDMVRSVARALCDVDTVRNAAAARGVDKDVLAALPPKDKPLLFETEPFVYQWHWFPSGREAKRTSSRPADEAMGSLRPEVWQSDADQLNAFVKCLGAVSEDTVDPSFLSNLCGLLPTTPSWADVRRSLHRLDRWQLGNDGEPYPEQLEDIALIAEMRKVLEDCEPVIDLAIVCSMALQEVPSARHLRESLLIVADALRLLESTTSGDYEKLNDLMTQIANFPANSSRLPPTFAPFPRSLDEGRLEEWRTNLESAVQSVALRPRLNAARVREFEASYWQYWERRLLNPANSSAIAGLGPIFCAVNRRAGGQLLSFRLENMSVGHWSQLFATEDGPPWLSLAVLYQLGFSTSAILRYTDQAPELKSYLFNAVPPWGLEEVPDSPAAVLLTHGVGHAFDWRPQPGYPLLLLSEVLPKNLMDNLAWIKESLNLAFFAIEPLEQSGSQSGTGKASLRGKRSNSETFPMTPADYALIVALKFESNGLIPVLVPEPTSSGNWPPNARPVTANSPGELFRQVSGLLRGSAPPVA